MSLGDDPGLEDTMALPADPEVMAEIRSAQQADAEGLRVGADELRDK